MKIFSLQSTSNLVIWSVVVGVLFSFLFIKPLLRLSPSDIYFSCEKERENLLYNWITPCPYYRAGWPVRVDIYDPKNYSNPFAQYYGFAGIINTTAFIGVAFVVLALVSQFTKKHNQLKQ
jgi:hypothetical protein